MYQYSIPKIFGCIAHTMSIELLLQVIGADYPINCPKAIG